MSVLRLPARPLSLTLAFLDLDSLVEVWDVVCCENLGEEVEGICVLALERAGKQIADSSKKRRRGGSGDDGLRDEPAAEPRATSGSRDS